MRLLNVDHVTKEYATNAEPVVALRDVSLSLESGEMIAVVGRSGCGKSTLLNLCGAMDFPSHGALRIDGVRTSGLDDAGLTRLRREKVGFIFQSFQLMHTLTALENVELPILLARGTHATAKALERLRWVELEGYRDRLVHQLSGGQQQRVAIARALVHSPRLLLADEPTGNLDSTTSEVVLHLLQRTAKEFGVGVMMATHSLEAAAIADKMIRLRDGMLEETPLPEPRLK
jgi:ABC-type lipoprotein export system ATPase subunit